jgi:dTDP-4-dehydrorhamnose 3,5-epimerase-like enzyme
MFRIPDEATDVLLPIPGVAFQRNAVAQLSGPPGWFTSKLMSSAGPLLSDYVTHGTGFTYDNYGIHVGQDDRLTFLGSEQTRIQGSFIDCRNGSAHARERVDVSFSPSPFRKLVIPRGVAHTFDNLSSVVTRDEPVLYSAWNNPDWNVDNDLIAFPRFQREMQEPLVQTNELPLPSDAHVLISRLSQHALRSPSRYLTRHRLRVAGEDVYVMLDASGWERSNNYHAPTVSAPGISLVSSKYAQTGEHSWTIVPTTDSCVSDLLFLHPSDGDAALVAHTRTRMIYTVLSGEGSELLLKFIDLRCGSESYRKTGELRITCDPRFQICIEPGIGYALKCAVSLIVRTEHEVFVSADEPRDDLMPFGNDLIDVTHGHGGFSTPSIRCPPRIVYLMALNELAKNAPESAGRSIAIEVAP